MYIHIGTYLFAFENVTIWNYHDLFLLLEINDLGHTVWFAGMIDVPLKETVTSKSIQHDTKDQSISPSPTGATWRKNIPCRTPRDRGVDNMVGVESEHVHSPIWLFVHFLSLLRHFCSDDVADVFDDHRPGLDIARGIQSKALKRGAKTMRKISGVRKTERPGDSIPTPASRFRVQYLRTTYYVLTVIMALEVQIRIFFFVATKTLMLVTRRGGQSSRHYYPGVEVSQYLSTQLQAAISRTC